jgi:three-Cys-motif partner protein
VEHQFGNISSWTKDKLDKVERYLDAYLTAMKRQRFDLEYIDAFAGTGYVTRTESITGPALFDVEETVQLKEFIDGSARIALRRQPPFDKYTFIEKKKSRCIELAQLKQEFPDLASRIEVIHGDANMEVMRLCGSDWLASYRRAVMFLDPYGTQVSWETITAIANTQAIDLWLLFPIGTVNRLLNKDSNIMPARKKRLDLLFGEQTWFNQVYSRVHRQSLFGSEVSFSKNPDPFGIITRYVVDRLKTIFPAVAENPLVMRNSTNSPIFLLCFASGNPKGGPIAVKIAQHILGMN